MNGQRAVGVFSVYGAGEIVDALMAFAAICVDPK